MKVCSAITASGWTTFALFLNVCIPFYFLFLTDWQHDLLDNHSKSKAWKKAQKWITKHMLKNKRKKKVKWAQQTNLWYLVHTLNLQSSNIVLLSPLLLFSLSFFHLLPLYLLPLLLPLSFLLLISTETLLVVLILLEPQCCRQLSLLPVDKSLIIEKANKPNFSVYANDTFCIYLALK